MHFDLGRLFQLIHVLEDLFHDGKRTRIFGHELWSEALGHGDVPSLQQHLLVYLILHFASSDIDWFFIALLSFLQQQLGFLQNLFTVFGQVLTILVIL